ncbi:MAG TPA: KTSC domain-containing protein [Polyangiaceae bacterium]|nr:KTSC domain-containing protein [Polyangiaceae bacterium]
MQRIPVVSSSVAKVGYDPEQHVLEVEFHGGRVYRYVHVPIAAYRLLLQAPSIGEYINRVIKPRFEAQRVIPESL